MQRASSASVSLRDLPPEIIAHVAAQIEAATAAAPRLLIASSGRHRRVLWFTSPPRELSSDERRCVESTRALLKTQYYAGTSDALQGEKRMLGQSLRTEYLKRATSEQLARLRASGLPGEAAQLCVHARIEAELFGVVSTADNLAAAITAGVRSTTPEPQPAGRRESDSSSDDESAERPAGETTRLLLWANEGEGPRWQAPGTPLFWLQRLYADGDFALCRLLPRSAQRDALALHAALGLVAPLDQFVACARDEQCALLPELPPNQPCEVVAGALGAQSACGYGGNFVWPLEPLDCAQDSPRSLLLLCAMFEAVHRGGGHLVDGTRRLEFSSGAPATPNSPRFMRVLRKLASREPLVEVHLRFSGECSASVKGALDALGAALGVARAELPRVHVRTLYLHLRCPAPFSGAMVKQVDFMARELRRAFAAQLPDALPFGELAARRNKHFGSLHIGSREVVALALKTELQQL